MSKAAGLGVVSEERSTFDNAVIITATPAPLWAEGSWGNVVKLGARWTSAAPDSVVLLLSYDSNITGSGPAYVGLNALQVNIDGEKFAYASSRVTDLNSSAYNSVSRTIYTSSTNSVVVPYSQLKRMISAKDCRLRVQTSKGYEDSQFSLERIPGGQPTALLSIRDLIDGADRYRASTVR